MIEILDKQAPLIVLTDNADSDYKDKLVSIPLLILAGIGWIAYNYLTGAYDEDPERMYFHIFYVCLAFLAICAIAFVFVFQSHSTTITLDAKEGTIERVKREGRSKTSEVFNLSQFQSTSIEMSPAQSQVSMHYHKVPVVTGSRAYDLFLEFTEGARWHVHRMASKEHAAALSDDLVAWVEANR